MIACQLGANGHALAGDVLERIQYLPKCVFPDNMCTLTTAFSFVLSDCGMRTDRLLPSTLSSKILSDEIAVPVPICVIDS